ncbi:MAG: efflux RND transporter permease subunit [Hyphomicrobiales bacterium]|nr:efflux RND transporter permease subunit [Hyphomicrobiales bacterium]
MKSFNLSEWALEHRSFVWFLMAIAMAAGIMAYFGMGREEDPSFTIKTMVIQVQWPGAKIGDTIEEITDRIEKEMTEIDAVDYTKSYTIPGRTTIFVYLKDKTRGKAVTDAFYQVRKHVWDIEYQFPQGILGPYFDDQFGDVYGNIYAFTADGFTMRQLRDYVEQARREVLAVPSIGKVEMIGAQDEAIYLDFSPRKLAGLGLDWRQVVETLAAQNAVAPTGVIQADKERVSARVTGAFVSEQSLREVNLRIGARFFRLADICDVSRGYVDPPDMLFRYDGQPAIGLAISMASSGNLLTFGEALKARMREIEGHLPIGVGVHLISDQPEVVKKAVDGFTEALWEAIAIVLGVSFVSLGLRAGLVVACSIPLVLVIVFVYLEAVGISLQRISLGALIIALGLLVDDAMITVEMMVSRLEAGDELKKAATFAYTSTAFPMLTGTLVTVVSFMPIGLNSSQAGEYTYTLFVVIACALLVSWFVAVVFAPLIGVTILPRTLAKRREKGPNPVLRAFDGLLARALRWRWLTIGATLALLGVAVFGLRFVEQQFFPSSDRPELLVDLTLPENSTIAATKAAMDRMEGALKGDDDIVRWSSYVGQGAIRFYLPLDEQLANAFFGQAVVVTKSLEARQRVQARLERLARDAFVGTDVWVHPLELGPPIGRSIQYRVSGPDVQRVREQALKFADVVASNPGAANPTFDWNEPGKVLQVDIAQDKARQLGVSSASISAILNATISGGTITQIRDDIYLIDVIGRGQDDARNRIENVQTLQVPTSNGSVAPLLAFAKVHYGLEQPIIWRRDRLPTVTVRAETVGEVQPATVVSQLAPQVEAFRQTMPEGYDIKIGGAVEESLKSQRPIAAVVPMMLVLMAVILMAQLQSVQKLILVVSVVPLGVIGVVASLLLFHKPLGFVAILGVLALIGIITRNSVILMAEINVNLEAGLDPWKAVVVATNSRFRPILLTAAAASLGMLPIAREVFWGPMAFAMIGGILAATVLTLVFLPALYVTWYRIKPPGALAEAVKAADWINHARLSAMKPETNH